MHQRMHHVVTDVAHVPSGYKWFDPRDESVKDELISLYISTHHQSSELAAIDTKPTDRHGLPYEWEKRRTGVIERIGKNIKTWVQPLGYVEAYDASTSKIEKALLSAEARAAEIEYLANTQNQELAPQWLELRANGITAIPFQMQTAIEDTEFGDHLSEADVAEQIIDYTLQGIKDGNRVEEFARESDYVYMQHGSPMRVHWEERDGKRGLVPNFRLGPKEQQALKDMLLRSIAQETAPSVEAIKALAALRTEMAARREFYGKNWRLSLLTPEEWKEYTLTRNTNKFLDTLDPERLEIAAEYEREAYEAIRPKIGDACPNEMCVDGKVLMRAWTKNGVKCADYDDCRLCNGRGTIMAALGFSIDIWEGVEYQPDEHDPLFSDNFWVLDFEDLSV